MVDLVEILRGWGATQKPPKRMDTLPADCREAAAEIERLRRELGEARQALEWYANPEIYLPHPHGPAFDRRDLSWRARAALRAEEEGR